MLAVVFYSCVLLTVVAVQHSYAGNSEQHTVSCKAASYADLRVLDSYVPETFCLDALTYETDVSLSVEEFYYLMGLTIGADVSRQQVYQGLYALGKKKIFDQLDLSIKKTARGYHLHVQARGMPVITRVKWHGGTRFEKIKQCYELRPTDIFDEHRHQQGIQAIKAYLARHGYCAAHVIDSVVGTSNPKELEINLQIELGPRYTVESWHIVLSDTSNVLLQAWLHDQVAIHHTNEWFTKKNINSVGKLLKKLLMERGFLLSEIRLTTTIDHAKQHVAVCYEIMTGKKSEYQFVGNDAFKTDFLLSFLFKIPNIGWAPHSYLVQELEKLYHDKGYLDATVRVHEQDEQTIITITEGPRRRLRRALIDGISPAMAPWYAQRLVNQCAKERFYSQSRIDRVITQLRSYYESHGFIDVTVSCTLRDTEKKGYSDIHFTVMQGTQYVVAQVVINGLPSTLLLQPFQTGIPFNAMCIAEQRKVLLNALRAHGYRKATVESCFDHQDGQVTVTWTCHAGDPIITGKTVIQGICPTDFSALQAHLQPYRFMTLRTNTFDQITEQLRSLGIFETITVRPDSSAASVEPVLVQLIPDDPFELRVRGGFAQVSKNFTFRPGSTYTIGGSLVYKNPLHHADLLRLDADATRFQHMYRGQYTIPFAKNIPTKGIIKVYDTAYKQPLYPGSDKTLYNALQRGGLFGISLDYYYGNVAVVSGIEWMELTDISTALARAIDFSPSLVNRLVPYVVIEPTVLLQAVDDPINPTNGFNTMLALKGVVPLDSFGAWYMRILFEHAFYKPLTRVLIGAARIRVGHIFNQYFERIMPIDRFYLGGAYSVRSYETDLAPPRVCSTDDGCCICVPKGGRSMVNLNAELRLDSGFNVFGALFQDIGMLTSNRWVGEQSHWVACTGVGIRYKTFFGLIRFDVGFKWRTEQDEPSYAWFLTLGNAF